MTDIANKIDQIGEVLGMDEDIIEGEYKEHSFTVDKDGNVTIGKKLTGVKPTAEITILTKGEGLEVLELQVIASTKEGEIESLEPINGAVLKTENSVSNKIYKVTNNGVYKFKIKGTNGRIAIVKQEISSLVLEIEAESILEGLSRVNISGLVKMKVNGKTTSEEEEKITYRLDVIEHDGDILLDGTRVPEMEGITLSSNVYTFGKAKDIATESTYAQNTVVLKVNGDLTIDEGVVATAIGGTYGGPKGLIIYCTGTLTNNGTITMTARGAKAVGENIYLYKNEDNSYEFVPAFGGGGGGNMTSNSAGARRCIGDRSPLGRRRIWSC